MNDQYLTDADRGRLKIRLERFFLARVKALKQQFDDLPLADVVYDHHISLDMQRDMQQLQAKNSSFDWFPSVHIVLVHVAVADDTPYSSHHQLSTTRMVPYSLLLSPSNTIALPLRKGMPLWQEASDLVVAIRTTQHQNKTALNDIQRLLRECRTFSQLLAQWPSAADFLPQNITTATQKTSPNLCGIAPLSEFTKATIAKARLIGASHVT